MRTHFALATLFILISATSLAKKPHKAEEKIPETEPAAEETIPHSAGVTVLSGEEAFEKTVEDLKAGVNMVHAESLSMGGGGGFPLALDKQPNGPCTACFTDALGDPVADPRWVKTGNAYEFTDGKYKASFTYDPATGKIETKK